MGGTCFRILLHEVRRSWGLNLNPAVNGKKAARNKIDEQNKNPE